MRKKSQILFFFFKINNLKEKKEKRKVDKKAIFLPIKANQISIDLPEYKNVIYIPIKDLYFVTQKYNDKDYSFFLNPFWGEIGNFIFGSFAFSMEIDKLKINNPYLRNIIYGWISNKLFFKNLDQLNIYSNEIILSELQWLGGYTIINHFSKFYPDYLNYFLDICKKLNINEELLEKGEINTNNMFLSRIDFFLEYSRFLYNCLTPIYKENKRHIAEYFSSRLLYVFAHTYFPVKYAPVTTLK